MRWGLLVIVIAGLALTPAAGSASSDRYVLWSARTAGVPPIPAQMLPADLPASVPQGSAVDLVDRTTGGRLAVATQTNVVIENLHGAARVVVPIDDVYGGCLLAQRFEDCPRELGL